MRVEKMRGEDENHQLGHRCFGVHLALHPSFLYTYRASICCLQTLCFSQSTLFYQVEFCLDLYHYTYFFLHFLLCMFQLLTHQFSVEPDVLTILRIFTQSVCWKKLLVLLSFHQLRTLPHSTYFYKSRHVCNISNLVSVVGY